MYSIQKERNRVVDSKDNQVNKEQTEEGSIMEFYLGQYVNYIEPLDGNFEMSCKNWNEVLLFEKQDQFLC